MNNDNYYLNKKIAKLAQENADLILKAKDAYDRGYEDAQADRLDEDEGKSVEGKSVEDIIDQLKRQIDALEHAVEENNKAFENALMPALKEKKGGFPLYFEDK